MGSGEALASGCPVNAHCLKCECDECLNPRKPRRPIAVFQLPLEEAPLLNRFMNMHWRKRHALKKQIALRLLSQVGRRKVPLTGRPQLLVTRYSTQRPDQDSAGTKLWLDELVKLGWLRDDSPDCVEVLTHWERAKRGEGRVVVHVYESAVANEEYERRQGWV